jgi:hypothetical protein
MSSGYQPRSTCRCTNDKIAALPANIPCHRGQDGGLFFVFNRRRPEADGAAKGASTIRPRIGHLMGRQAP